jgi:hypothetical protein
MRIRSLSGREAYFRFSDGDDPPVYVYAEDELEPKKWASSFSEYLSKSFDEALDTRKQLKYGKSHPNEMRHYRN